MYNSQRIDFGPKYNLVIDAKFMIRELKMKETSLAPLGYNPNTVNPRHSLGLKGQLFKCYLPSRVIPVFVISVIGP